MNTTQISPHVITPLKNLWRWLMAQPGSPSPVTGARATPTGPLTHRPWPHQASKPAAHALARTVHRKPLRVLRVVDAGQAPAHVGRLRISGRMADVCAELDRMVAQEARLLH